MILKSLPPLPPIRDLIRIYGLSANQKFSQNFILDKNVTGPGLLTRSILDAGAQRVIVVEKDNRFVPALQQLSEASDQRLGIIMGDMLNLNHADIFKTARELSVSPLISSAPSETLSTLDQTIQNLDHSQVAADSDISRPLDDNNATVRLLGNLPFGIASPLLIQWLKMMALRQGIFQANNKVSMTLMFQKEVAQGIVAPPHHPQRSRLSIMAQSICNVKIAYKAPSGVFVPKPKVDAAVVHFEMKEEPLVPGSLEKLEDVARYYFNKRRKTMGNNTNRMARLAPKVKPILDEWIAEGGWDMNMRTEDVSTEQFCALARKLDRGNQRDTDRAKAQKKLAQLNKGKKTDGVSHTKRAESDAEIMRAKQAAKEAAKNAGAGGAAAPPEKK
ncbi:Dimethyladenosine transferase 1, mitochondrial [Mortierella sp. AM989]|nr:Dimethyladenosine transferase 1, mitochondrial [Mortierella sp. AM989]